MRKTLDGTFNYPLLAIVVKELFSNCVTDKTKSSQKNPTTLEKLLLILLEISQLRLLSLMTWIICLTDLQQKNSNTQKPTSHQYLVDIHSTASNVFETAIDNDIIFKNPARGREISRYAPKTARRALTSTEQKLIICTPHRAHIGAFIMMLADLRRGELIPLTWDDIDLDNLRINITKSVEEKQVNHFALKMEHGDE